MTCLARHCLQETILYSSGLYTPLIVKRWHLGASVARWVKKGLCQGSTLELITSAHMVEGEN